MGIRLIDVRRTQLPFQGRSFFPRTARPGDGIPGCIESARAIEWRLLHADKGVPHPCAPASEHARWCDSWDL